MSSSPITTMPLHNYSMSQLTSGKSPFYDLRCFKLSNAGMATLGLVAVVTLCLLHILYAQQLPRAQKRVRPRSVESSTAMSLQCDTHHEPLGSHIEESRPLPLQFFKVKEAGIRPVWNCLWPTCCVPWPMVALVLTCQCRSPMQYATIAKPKVSKSACVPPTNIP